MYKNEVHDQRQKLQAPSGHATPGYTTKELEDMKTALNKKLGPEFISKRKGPGYNSIQYLEGWKAINLANEIFGPNGWCTELKEFKVDYIDDKHGVISLGLSCIVRVILKDGTFHEDVGYGSIENCRGKAMAFDKCKKEAFTDGMKRALRQFGNALGNCLYDKEFLQHITKVSSEPVKFDANSLMRRSTTTSKTITPKVESEFRVDREAPPPSQMRKPSNEVTEKRDKETAQAAQGNVKRPGSSSNKQEGDKRREGKHKSTNDKGPSDRTKEDVDDSFIFSDDWPEDEEIDEQILDSNNFVKNEDLPDSDFEGDGDGDGEAVSGIEGESTLSTMAKSESEQPKQERQEQQQVINSHIPEQVTFVSATSADTIQQDPSLQKSLKFDVSFSSTQIQKSSFINHSKSLPVKKSQVRNDDNKENKSRKPIGAGTTAATATLAATTNAPGNKSVASNSQKNTSTDKPAAASGSSLGVRPPTTSNPLINAAPLVKRSFGLPPNKLQNKRLKK